MLQSESKIVDRSDPDLLAALRERRYFLIAEKYGQSPASVREWSDYDFNRAMMNFTAESGDVKMTPDDVKQVKESRPMARPGYVLDLPFEHWQRFLTDGQLDADKLKAGNYTEEQFDYIQGELNTLGWLVPAEYTTGPLSDDAPED